LGAIEVYDVDPPGSYGDESALTIVSVRKAHVNVLDGEFGGDEHAVPLLLPVDGQVVATGLEEVSGDLVGFEFELLDPQDIGLAFLQVEVDKLRPSVE
jgi:hypothetical protein